MKYVCMTLNERDFLFKTGRLTFNLREFFSTKMHNLKRSLRHFSLVNDLLHKWREPAWNKNFSEFVNYIIDVN